MVSVSGQSLLLVFAVYLWGMLCCACSHHYYILSSKHLLIRLSHLKQASGGGLL